VVPSSKGGAIIIIIIVKEERHEKITEKDLGLSKTKP
jgi:uncharacterized ferredoxin-like protein